MNRDPDLDPKGLIFEAYRIEGIGAAECRSIFLDWALSLPPHAETSKAIRALLEHHKDQDADHPMTVVLRQGLGSIATPRRRGGWRSRPRN